MNQKCEKFHVLYIITKLELGGAQKVCLALMDGLRANGQEVSLISGAQGTLVEQVKDLPNVYLLDDFKREISLKGLCSEWQAFKQLILQIKTLKQHYPNLIVHTHSTKAGIVGRWAAWCAGVQYRIHTIHGYAFHKHQSFLIWWTIYLGELITSIITTHFVCVSNADAMIGKKIFPGFAKKFSLIRAAVDHEQFFLPAKIEKKKEFNIPFIFGTIACFKPQKNLFDLLKAFALVYEQNKLVRLEIIGDGVLRCEIEHWIIENKLEEVIFLHGWQKNVREILCSWNAFVLSSLWEGLPCAIVEARLLKLPVLSYDTGGIADIIKHGENGFLYNQRNWQELAWGMLRLSQDNQLVTKLSHYPDQLNEFSYEVMIKRHISLYEQSIGNLEKL